MSWGTHSHDEPAEMKRTELKRGKPLERKTPLRNNAELRRSSGGPERNNPELGDRSRQYSTLRRGRGFAASKAQQEKVRGMACVACGAMTTDYTVIDPAHLCAQGMGGCDEALCVVPLCRSASWTTPDGGCHPRFDRGELDLTPFLEPTYRAEVAHCVMHLGLFGAVRRLTGGRADERRSAA